MARRRRGFARAIRWTARGAAGFVVLAAALAASGYAYLRTSLPETSGRLQLPVFGAPVEIVRDRHGVPHIFAQSERDAYAALGFVHAQDRLAQMDLMRRTAEGRLSEVIGAAALAHDRFVRTLGLRGQADAAFAALTPETRAVFEAYAAGVNAYLTSHGGAWPPEILFGGIAPPPWEPVHSLLWGRLMSVQLAVNWRGELTRARLASRLTPEMLAELWPDHPPDAATTLARLAADFGSLALDRLAAALPPPLGPDQASNEWVISGERTTTGKPLLANDPHLGLGAPGVWYLARIEAPGLSLAGATAPGVPLLVLGHNGALAWGFTTTNADTQDLFFEKIADGDPALYETPAGPRSFSIRSEIIAVKGDEPVTLSVRSTRHGVVLSDLALATDAVPPGYVLALAEAAAERPDRTADALYRMNRAKNAEEFVAALSSWHAPVQNIVYADTAGRIGVYTAGRVPRRKSGDGWIPQPGWGGEFDWLDFIPFAELPHAADPPSGRLINANNRVVSDGYPFFVSRDWDSPERAERIAERLAERAKHDIASMESIQADDVSLFARRLLPTIAHIRTNGARDREALSKLANWDARMDRGRSEPLIFNAWVRQITADLLVRGLGPGATDLLRESPVLVRHAFEGTSEFCDDRTTDAAESCADLVSAALSRALDELTRIYGADTDKWRWGDAHAAAFVNPLFSRIPVLARWTAFRQPTDGDNFTIRRAAARPGDSANPFAHVHGQSLRAVYDLADLRRSRFIIAPGQSGSPLSPHWGDLVPLWAHAGSLALSGDAEALLADGASRLVLTPTK